mmetsp:Transcript_19997/g.32529  ORF Transcript_19997/g.32529 Transcript_19997/m.32529 type:complete len:401 (-) Transcript_19997:257-1459(-)
MLSLKFWVALFFFDITGLSNSLLANELDLLGVAKPTNGLQVMALYVGQFLGSLLFYQGWLTLRWYHIRKVAPLVVLDVVSNIAYWTALLKAGSGITTVVYTTIVVFSALFQFLLFGKRLTYSKMVGIAGIIGFVSLASVDQVQSNSEDAGSMLLGVILAAAAAAGFGLDFVIANYLLEVYSPERLLNQSGVHVGSDDTSDPHLLKRRAAGSINGKDIGVDESDLEVKMLADGDYDECDSGQDRRIEVITEAQLQVVMSLGIIPSVLYFLCFTIPFRQEQIIQPSNHVDYPNGGNWRYIWMIYVFFIMSNGTHQTGYFYTVGEGPIAAVTVSVNKGLQSAIVFLGSDFVYCKVQHSQCLTTLKIIGMIGVVLSVIWYAVGDLVIKRFSSRGNNDFHIMETR